MRIRIKHCKIRIKLYNNPFQTTSIVESKTVFLEFVAHIKAEPHHHHH